MSRQNISVDPSADHFWRIPEGADDDKPSFSGWDWGTLDLMGGKILVQFSPLGGTGLVSRIGRNGADLEEIKEIAGQLTVAEMRRTVRTLLR